jgi:hypothetical protein
MVMLTARTREGVMRWTVFTPRGMIILVMSIVLILVMSGVFVAVATAGTRVLDDPAELAKLESLGSIHTILGTTVPDVSARFDALYTDLQTDVESRLHQAGIPVDSSFTARLVVFVDIFGEDDPTGCRATIEVAVREFALEPGTVPRPDAPLADNHRALRASCADIEQLVREDTSDLVDGFITAHLAPASAATAGIAPSHP